MTGGAIRCRASPSTPTQLTSSPTWSPDGKHIVYSFRSAAGFGLGWIRADGAGELQRLLDGKNTVYPYSFFPDGKRLAFHETDPGSNSSDLWTLRARLKRSRSSQTGEARAFPAHASQ